MLIHFSSLFICSTTRIKKRIQNERKIPFLNQDKGCCFLSLLNLNKPFVKDFVKSLFAVGIQMIPIISRKYGSIKEKPIFVSINVSRISLDDNFVSKPFRDY